MSKQQAGADKAFVEQQRKRLIAMRDELLQRGSTQAARAQDRTTRPEGVVEMEDEAQRLAQSEVDGAVDVVEQRRLRLVDRALAKIDEGTYGLSEESGDPIPRARLEAIPEALLTIEEVEARERRQRR